MDGTTPQIRTEDILLALIARSATNPRTTFDEDSLRELGQSMATVGQIHPALVRPRGEGFELVAGERRWRAAALAGLLTLRCEVRDLTDEQVEEIQLVENAGREDVHPLEEAVALQRCVARGRTPQYLADRLGRPVRWVQKRLALMNLIETARAWLRSERLPIAHAQQLAALAPSTQGRVLARFGANAPIPTAREFARAIGYESHAVEAAPFDTKDATLPGHGPCAKCVHRSDAQADLFEGASADALCLDAACWSQKTDATWLRVERSAAKKKLTVLADAAGVFAYGDRIDHNAPYVAEPPVEGAKPVAVVRAPSGRAVELYAKPARSGGGDDDEEDGPETDEEREERVRNETRWAEKRAAAEAEGRARAERLLAVAGTKDGVLLFLRAGLLGFLEQLEAPALRPMLALLGEPAALLAQSDDAVVVRIEDEHLLRVVAAVLADERLHTAESVEEDGAELTELDALLLERFRGDVPMPESPTLHRLWILARPFGELNEDGRAMYDHADVDLDIEWETRGEYVTAEVPEKAASIVLTLAKEDGFAVHTGAEPPPPVATTELRVIRGDWLQHRSGLRDTARAPLHKQWAPDGDDRVARVKRGSDVVSQVLAYCQEHKVALRLDGNAVSPKVEPPASAPATRTKPKKESKAAKVAVPAPEEPAPQANLAPLHYWLLDSDWQHIRPELYAHLANVLCYRAAGSIYRRIGPLSPEQSEGFAADLHTYHPTFVVHREEPPAPAPPPPATHIYRLGENVLTALREVRVEFDADIGWVARGTRGGPFTEEVDRVLRDLGGGWAGKIRAHAFPADPTAAIAAVLESGGVSIAAPKAVA